MATTKAKITIRQGLKVALPTLSANELGFCTDTKELFIGSSTGNVKLNGVNMLRGSANFNSTTGVTISHSVGNTNFTVSIQPSQNPNGYLGEVWVEKSTTNFKVCCSGTATTTFDYVLVW